jgi:hypothetical protein
LAWYLTTLTAGFVILALIEAGVWVQVCLGLSMKHEHYDFTDLMRHAPYRIFWPPKITVACIALTLFIIATRYYRWRGGTDILLAGLCFIFMAVFAGLVFWESLRAIKQYEEK